MIKNKLLHGIEVVNFDTFSEEAFSIALDENLTKNLRHPRVDLLGLSNRSWRS